MPLEFEIPILLFNLYKYKHFIDAAAAVTSEFPLLRLLNDYPIHIQQAWKCLH